ncbi:MAG: LTA synthase family protein [Synergistaceae bacterium]|nr:LTA synthase family protein [Synergistaceae bacterium]
MDYNFDGRSFRKAGRDYRELFFFAVMTAAIFFKFLRLEHIVFGTDMPFLIRPAALAASLAVVLVFIVPVSLLWNRIRPWAAFFVDFLFNVLLMTDLMHMRYYSDLFTLANMGLSTQVGAISESVFALFSLSDIFFFLDFPILAGYLVAAKKISVKPFFKTITLNRLALSILTVAFASSVVCWHIYSYNKRVPGVLACPWDKPAICVNIGALTYHVVDARNTLKDKVFKEDLPEGKTEEIAQWFADRAAVSSDVRPKFFGTAKGRNLIMIQVESLQHFVPGLRVNGAEVTPNLNRFLKESVLFSRVYNQTALGNSSDSELLVNAGLFPSPSGVAYVRFAGNHYEALPKLLADNGYSTLALHGDRPGFWNRDHMYPALGFQRFVSRMELNDSDIVGMGISDRSFFKQAVKILAKEPRPFYAFLVTLSSHYPFDFPELLSRSDLKTGKLEGLLIGNYLKSMRYFDSQFGMFIKELKANGLADSSVIMVYGDHTAIPEWDRSELEKTLGRDLKQKYVWRDMLKVPLIIRFPGGKAVYEDKKTPSGLVDVPKTAANLLGFDYDMGFGRNIFAPYKGEPVVFRSGSYITGNVFVDQSSQTAVNLRSGKNYNYGDFAVRTENVNKQLEYNDAIFTHDLIGRIMEINGTGKRR